jgi:hypothetical protein
MNKPFAICACAKNEDDYIKEWIEYHIKLGFDRIYLCDNNDDARLESFLTDYTRENFLIIYDYRGARNFQIDCYNEMIRTYKQTYAWCAFIDIDEFITLEKHSNIKDFLDDIRVDVVFLNWMIMSSDCKIYKEAGGVLDRFRNPVSLNHTRNRHIKSIVREGVEGLFVDNPHNIKVPSEKYSHAGEIILTESSPWVESCRYETAYIRHYYTKSFEEWITKVGVRKWPDSTEVDRSRWLSAFLEYEPCSDHFLTFGSTKRLSKY